MEFGCIDGRLRNQGEDIAHGFLGENDLTIGSRRGDSTSNNSFARITMNISDIA